MPTDSAAAPAQAQAARFAATGPEHCIAKRHDGVYADPAVLGTTLAAAIDSIFRGGHYLSGIDYPVLLKALFDHGPALPTAADGTVQARIAADMLPFDPARRELYRSVKIGDGRAEYYFEPVWLPDAADPDGPGMPARLDLDEFVADIWLKGIRFGVDIDAVRAAIASGKADRITVARRLDPVPGQDARIAEVSDDIHRNDAPRELPNGKLDLGSFQNRFPQIQPGVRLLQKIPLTEGKPGFEMAGSQLTATPGRDLDLGEYAGEGTKVERLKEGEFLVSHQAGFLTVDSSTSRISLGAKIVSRDGVSARTTGNLQLTGDYEEFGDVQEKRVIEGNGITVHGNVYGEIISRGGMVRLRATLVGGSIHNKLGDIQVDGVTAKATIQATAGTVTLQRAENCDVSGTRVRIEQALNCEIIADEVSIGNAEGCAVAARGVTIDSTAPWRGSEMLVYVLVAECGRIDEVLGQIGTRLAQFDAAISAHKAEQAHLCAQPAVRKYLEIVARVRSGEMSLTPPQAQQFKQMGQAVAADLARIGEVSNARKAAETEKAEGQALFDRFTAQRSERTAGSEVVLRRIIGDTQVRSLPYDPDRACFYDLAAREIKARLRGNEGTPLHAAASGSYAWPASASAGTRPS